ncbi:MAG TPA: hypothetical protein VMM78_09180 [Thermomicrobiales bacterium]|nr:hypothetical protein [Thermomicrobiales bacterium]
MVSEDYITGFIAIPPALKQADIVAQSRESLSALKRWSALTFATGSGLLCDALSIGAGSIPARRDETAMSASPTANADIATLHG